MNNYEVIVILKPSLPENIRKGVQDRIEGIIKKEKGEIVNTDIWGKKYLAYPINKHVEGYYILFQVKAETAYIKPISQSLKLISDILRYGIFKVNEFASEGIKDNVQDQSIPALNEDDGVNVLDEDVFTAKI